MLKRHRVSIGFQRWENHVWWEWTRSREAAQKVRQGNGPGGWVGFRTKLMQELWAIKPEKAIRECRAQ